MRKQKKSTRMFLNLKTIQDDMLVGFHKQALVYYQIAPYNLSVLSKENIEFEKAFINQVVELSDQDFDYFSKNLLDDYPFIHQLQENMKDPYAGNRQTIAIVNESNNDGILVDSQGYRYARYAAYVDEINL